MENTRFVCLPIFNIDTTKVRITYDSSKDIFWVCEYDAALLGRTTCYPSRSKSVPMIKKECSNNVPFYNGMFESYRALTVAMLLKWLDARKRSECADYVREHVVPHLMAMRDKIISQRKEQVLLPEDMQQKSDPAKSKESNMRKETNELHSDKKSDTLMAAVSKIIGDMEISLFAKFASTYVQTPVTESSIIETLLNNGLIDKESVYSGDAWKTGLLRYGAMAKPVIRDGQIKYLPGIIVTPEGQRQIALLLEK